MRSLAFLVVTLLSHSFLPAAHANEIIKANQFTCKGENFESILILPTQENEEISLKTVIEGEARTFAAQEITVVDSAIGLLYYVETTNIPSFAIFTLNLAIPAVHLIKNDEKTLFETIAIYATKYNSVEGPQKRVGPLRESRAVNIDCEASLTSRESKTLFTLLDKLFR